MGSVHLTQLLLKRIIRFQLYFYKAKGTLKLKPQKSFSHDFFKQHTFSILRKNHENRSTLEAASPIPKVETRSRQKLC